MAIVNMSKFNLISFEEDRGKLLDELQKFEYIHFSDPTNIAEAENLSLVGVSQTQEDLEDKIDKVEWMLELLEERAEKKSGLQNLKDGLRWLSLEELRKEGSSVDGGSIYKTLKGYEDEIKEIDAQIKSKENDINNIKKRSFESDSVSIISGTIPEKNIDSLNSAAKNFTSVHLEYGEKEKKEVHLSTIVINDEYERLLKALEENGFQLDTEPGKYIMEDEIALVEAEISDLQGQKAELNKKIDENTRYIDDLQVLYEYLKNENLKYSKAQYFMEIDDVDIITGYVPTKMVDDFDSLLKNTLGDTYFLELTEADKKDDSTPVLLENNNLIKPFESITLTYSRPKYSEMDPTPIMSIFYWVFFGMMVADLGYGLVLTILTGIALASFNLSDSFRSTVKFFFYMGISTMIWGLIYGSFFGYSLPFYLLDNSQYGPLLIFVIILGAIHLFTGLILQGYLYLREGKVLDAIYDVVFWFMALIGVALLLLGVVGIVGKTPQTIGTIIMIIGMVGIVLFGGRSANSIPVRLALGAYELYGITSWLGDFVSYSRLMALMLSGGFIAVAINLIISMLPNNILGIIGGIIIFLAGHAFNIFLSLLSAYVHDMRLQYVEFFGKFYEGGGEEFETFVNDTKYINLK